MRVLALALVIIAMVATHSAAASGYWATWKADTANFWVYMGPFTDVPACVSFGNGMGAIKDFTFLGCFDQIPQ